MTTSERLEHVRDYVNRIYPATLCRMKVKEDRLAIQFKLHKNQGNPLAIVFKEAETIMYELGNEITQLYVVPAEYGATPIERRLMVYYMDSMSERQ